MNPPREAQREHLYEDLYAYYARDPITAMIAAQHAKNHIANMPEFLDSRLEAPFDNPIWSLRFTTLSEEIVGRYPITESDEHGVGREVREPHLIVRHNRGFFNTPQTLSSGLTQRYASAGMIDEKEFFNLLSGKMSIQNREYEYRIEELLDAVTPQEPYFVVLTKKELPPSGIVALDALLNNKLYIARCGSLERATQYQKRLQEYARFAKKPLHYGITHPFSDPSYFSLFPKAHARLLTVQTHSLGLDGSVSIDHDARFLSLPPRRPIMTAHDWQEISAQWETKEALESTRSTSENPQAQLPPPLFIPSMIVENSPPIALVVYALQHSMSGVLFRGVLEHLGIDTNTDLSAAHSPSLEEVLTRLAPLLTDAQRKPVEANIRAAYTRNPLSPEQLVQVQQMAQHAIHYYLSQ